MGTCGGVCWAFATYKVNKGPTKKKKKIRYDLPLLCYERKGEDGLPECKMEGVSFFPVAELHGSNHWQPKRWMATG